MSTHQIHKTDVLIIGGGIAGCMAGIRARDLGAEVLLLDKGYVGYSGQTPYAGSLMVFDPDRHDRDTWITQFRQMGDYATHVGWAGIMLDRSKECFQDLESYGVAFFRNEDGSPFEASMGTQASTAVLPIESSLNPTLRKHLLKVGGTIHDRTMALDLVQDANGRVTGVVAMTVEGAEYVVYEAKSVIIAAGASGLKPPRWPISNLTADGDVMAYRAGAAITGKEFVDPHGTDEDSPCYSANTPIKRDESIPSHGAGRMGPRKVTNGAGNPLMGPPGLNLSSVLDVHAGLGPIYMNETSSIPCASFGMATHKAEGIFPVGMDCSVGVDGLYAAGDSLGTMMSGASYAGIGTALMGSAVTGKLAAETAVAQLIAEHIPMDEALVEAKREKFFAPMARKGGFAPRWTIRVLQNIMMPYYVFMVKEENRLQGALDHVRYLKSAIVPKLRAADPHELRLAIETENMIINCEFKLMAALARKESRGSHIREDYPAQNEDEFGGWIAVKEGADGMETFFTPMPKEWRKQPDEIYLTTFPFD